MVLCTLDFVRIYKILFLNVGILLGGRIETKHSVLSFKSYFRWVGRWVENENYIDFEMNEIEVDRWK